MKIAIYHNDNQESQAIATQLKTKLTTCAFLFDQENPEIVITIGGDGTLLSAFHHYVNQLSEIRFIGVHTGHLGFYTDWRDYELDELVSSLQLESQKSVSYPLLDVEIFYSNGQLPEHYLSLNESSLKRIEMTMMTDIYIKEELFERFRGDGLCISTPTGSTGYNKSIGGAVVHPGLEAIQMTEIASINNRVYRTLSSPIIISPNEWIVLRPEDAHDKYLLTIDQKILSRNNIDRIVFKIAKERIHFAKYRHTHFWKRVEESFIGAQKDEI